ncbi:MAG TPA: CpaF family protein, partial [Armatimonadota bacterium]
MSVAKLRRQQQTISDRTAFYELEYRMLDLLLPDIDQDLMARQSEVLVARELQEMILTLLERQSVILTREDRLQLIEDLVDEVVGYGPIDKLLKDPSVDEVMVNGPRHVFVERQGRLHRVDRRFRDNDHVITIAQKIVSAIGRRVDESAPMVDARLPDGSRVNAIVPPLAIDGPTITVRKFGKGPMSADDLVRHGTMTTKVMEFLRAAVRSRLNIIISGGTGSGKTSTLNVLSSFIGESERIITIEDAAELRLQQGHVVRLESRPPNIEGRGQVTIRDLVRNALRMRPDRIVVGEVRGGETLDMLQAMNTGHDGSMTTLHANSPREALSRLEVMSLMAGMDLPLRAVREQMCAAINLVVHQARLRDGSRRITQITEVQGMEGDTP